MNTNLDGHDRPINRQASGVFWKAPWWAKYPEAAKPALWSLKQKEHSWEAWVDYTKAPPLLVKDYRGYTFTIHEDTAVVIGFSRTLKKEMRMRAGRSKPKWWIGDGWDTKRRYSSSDNVQIWWATFQGEIVEVWRKRDCEKKWRRYEGSE